jgi:hypothetical protein
MMKKLDAYFSYTDPDDGAFTETHNVEEIPDDWSQEKISNYLDDYLNAFQDDILERGGDDLAVQFQFYIDGENAW